MRILTVVQDLGRGGTQRVAQTFSLEYAKRGHKVAVLAHSDGGIRQEILEQADLPVFIGGDQDLALDSALAAADQFDPEVIHLHHTGHPDPRVQHILKRLKTNGRRVVASSHFGRIDWTGGDALIDAHLHLSRWCLWRWHRWLGSRQECGVVIPNPVDIDRFERAAPDEIERYRREQLKVPDGAFVCGRVGQRLPGKWHPALFHAFTALADKHPDAYFALNGMPDQIEGDLQALPKHVRERVIRVPLIDNDRELALLYSSLDVFLHAAQIGETFGLVLTEAMLCNTPAITLNTPHKDNSQPDVVGHGVGGYVALAPAYLTQALLQAYEHREELAAMAAGCRESVVERFNAQRVSDLAVRAIEHVCASTDKQDLQRRFTKDEQLISEVDDAEIYRACRDGIGKPSAMDLLKMRLITNPLLYRCYRAIR